MSKERLPKIGYKKWHYLKSNEKRKLPRFIIAVDTETEPEQIDEKTELHKLKLGWAIFKDRLHNKEEAFYFENVKDFWDWLKSKCKNKTTLYVFAHNFDYDFQVLNGFKYLTEHLGAKITKFIVDSNVFIVRARLEGFDGLKSSYCNLEFISTTNYSNYSLKKIGKILGLEKFEIDFKSASKEELKRYCYRDTEIVLRFVEYLLKFIEEHDLGNFQPTIASQAFNAFRHRFMKHKILIHAHPKATELERLSYRGGRTEAFFIGKWTRGTVYKLDVNSMYPFVMKAFEYPVKLVRVLPYTSVDQLKRIMKQYLVIAKVKVYISVPAIGVKREKLIFPIGVFWAVLTSPELELVMKNGQILEVKDVAIYEKAKIFEDYVDYFYNLRLKFKEEGNEVMQYFAKIMLNSLYGKFGQRNESFKTIGFTEDPDFRAERVYDADEGRWRYIRQVGHKIEEKDGYVEGSNSFVAIASFVTAYARCYLWELIEKAGEGNVLYCDTDSLFVTEAGLNNLKPYLDNKELGKLKVEGVTDKLIIWGAKNYIFGDEIKRKGIRKDAVQIDNNTFEQIQFIKIRSNMLKYHLPSAGTIKVRKQLKAEYDKGIITPSGWVEPFVLNED